MNYYNYFTEVEEHFQRARGTGLFLLSPLDWALIETWKNDGVPLEAVRRGIDAAFENWRKKRSRTRMVNSLAFCAQAVLTEAAGMPAAARAPAPPPFPASELRAYLLGNAEALRRAGHDGIAAALEGIEVDEQDLESLEQRLTALEAKLIAHLTSACPDDRLVAIRRDLDLQLRPYRGKMSAPQLALLERQYIERRLLADSRIPKLSLFYLK
ncbi:MAG: hypothetical protein ACRD96_15410 [Bryobacteraceae bacterium]